MKTIYQKIILKKHFTNYEILNISKDGITLEEQKKLSEILLKKEVVFLSPIPFILGTLCKYSEKSIYVFCNSKRSKNENGKEIKFTLESEGWQLIKI